MSKIENQDQALRFIADMETKGLTRKQIAGQLKRAGWRSDRTGRPWSHLTVTHYIRQMNDGKLAIPEVSIPSSPDTRAPRRKSRSASTTKNGNMNAARLNVALEILNGGLSPEDKVEVVASILAGVQ